MQTELIQNLVNLVLPCAEVVIEEKINVGSSSSMVWDISTYSVKCQERVKNIESIYFEPPTTREDGQKLDPSEIKGYRIDMKGECITMVTIDSEGLESKKSDCGVVK